MFDRFSLPIRLRTEVLRRDPTARRWLDQLPRLWQELSDRWGLTQAGTLHAGAVSLVVPVRSDTGPAALKIISPIGDIEDEAAALTAFAGGSAVRLLAADLDRGALLLEWLPGPLLIVERDRSAAMRIAGEIAGRLADVSAPAGAHSMAEDSVAWLTQLEQQHAVAQEQGTAVSESVFSAAHAVVTDLRSADDRRLTHGDLSLHNIRQAADGRWVAIDPYFTAGPAAHEGHTVVRSHLHDIVPSSDPAGLMSSWTREFSEAADVDHSYTLRISLARYVASYYWESQHAGDHTNIADLRRACTLAMELSV